MTVYAVLAVFFFIATFALTKERVVPISEKRPALKDDVRDLLSNRPWLILVAATIFTCGFAGVRSTVVVYYFKYYVRAEPLAAMYLVIGSLVSIVGIYLIQFVTPRFGKKKPYIVCMVCAAVLSVASYWAAPHDYFSIFAYQVLINFFVGPPSAMIWSLYADTADYSELATGRRATGLIFSASGMSQKLGWTIASSVTGYLLAYYHFEPNVEQTLQTQTGIRLMVTVFPALCCLGAAAVMLLYPLNEKRVREIELKLKAARNVREAAVVA
jgi:GPH family glycoside/pentoside/hexuronide:cation symporter